VIRIRFTDHDSLFTLGSSAARESSSNLAVAMSCLILWTDTFNRRFKFEKRCRLFVGPDDESVSIVAVHANIAFDFVELKLDGVLRDG
jgi:hypothetical protein